MITATTAIPAATAANTVALRVCLAYRS